MKLNTLTYCMAMLCCCMLSISQSADYPGPVSQSLAYVKVFDKTPWASLSNVAGLAQQQYLSAGVAYQLRFNIEELSSRVATVIVPTKYGNVSGLIFQSGYSKSNYSRYALSYSRLFGSKIAVGFQYNYLTHHIAEADRAEGLYSSFGITIQTTNTLMLGVFIQNPEQSKITYYETSYTIPGYFNAALCWSAYPHFLIITEFEKEVEYAPVYKSGVQFNFKDKLFIRGGIKGQPVEFTFGAGFHSYKLAVDIGFSHHQQLGLTSGAGIIYSFKPKE